MVQGVNYCPQGGPILGMGMDEHGSGEGSGSTSVRMGGGNYDVEPLPQPEESPGCWTRFRNWLRGFCTAIRDFFSCKPCCEESSDSVSLQGDDDVVYSTVKFTPRVGVNRPPSPEPEEGDSVYSDVRVGGASGTGGDPKPPQEEEEEDIFGEVGVWPPRGPDNPTPPSDGIYENWGHKPFTSSGGGHKPEASKPAEEPIYGNVGGGTPQPQPPKPKPRTVKSSSGGGPRHHSGPLNGDEYAVVHKTKL